MNDDQDLAVTDRQWELWFDELAGRAHPPDRTAAILARAAAQPAPKRRRVRPARLVAAALLLLGAAIPIAVAMIERGGATPEAAAPPAAVASAQEPKPAPQDTPQHDPQPTPKSDGAPLPKGTDPADLAAMRSAEAMLQAERILAQRLAEGRIVGVDEILPFDELTGWTYENGLRGMPERIRARAGSKVLMTGFMLPIDEVEGMQHFLLVKSLWSCCYGTPPDVNGIVRCVMPAGKTTNYRFEPLKIVGRFDVQPTVEDGYCVDIFQLHVELLEVIE